MNLVIFHTLLQSKMPNEDVFVVNMPETISRGILILHGASGAKLDANLPDYKIGNIQAIVRDTDYQSGYDFAKSVLNALNVTNQYVGVVEIKYINPLHDPMLFPPSKSGLVEFSLNFKTAYVEH